MAYRNTQAAGATPHHCNKHFNVVYRNDIPKQHNIICHTTLFLDYDTYHSTITPYCNTATKEKPRILQGFIALFRLSIPAVDHVPAGDIVAAVVVLCARCDNVFHLILHPVIVLCPEAVRKEIQLSSCC